MTGAQVLFIIISFITLISGWIVVTDRNLFHAALAMMLSFLGVAGLYVMLDAGFLAAAQLLVYIGAISILVIFAIMMTRRLMQTNESPYNSQWVMGGVASFLVFGLFMLVLLPVFPLDQATGAPANPVAIDGMVVTMGQLLVSAEAYVIPFEIASVLLLAALVGSIIIARPEGVTEGAG